MTIIGSEFCKRCKRNIVMSHFPNLEMSHFDSITMFFKLTIEMRHVTDNERWIKQGLV